VTGTDQATSTRVQAETVTRRTVKHVAGTPEGADLGQLSFWVDGDPPAKDSGMSILNATHDHAPRGCARCWKPLVLPS